MIDVALGLVLLFATAAALSSGCLDLYHRVRGMRQFYLYRALVDLLDCSDPASGAADLGFRETEPTPAEQARNPRVTQERRAAFRCARLILGRYRRERSLKAKPGHLEPGRFALLLLDFEPHWPSGLRLHLSRLCAGLSGAGRRPVIERWYAAAMEDHREQWRQHSRRRLIVIGLLLAVALNLNPSKVIAYAERKPEALREIASEIDTARAGGASEQELGRLGLELGADGLFLWNDQDRQRWARSLAQPAPALMDLLGWLTVALAASLGAPFWFDLLRRVVSRSRDGGGGTAADDGRQPAPESSPDPGGQQPAVASAPPRVLSDWHQRQSSAPLMADFADRPDFWLCFLSREVYADGGTLAGQGQQTVRRLREQGHRALWCLDAGAGTECLVVAIDADTIAVVFRGTESAPEDWATDARAFPMQPHWVPPAQGGPQRRSRGARILALPRRCWAWLLRRLYLDRLDRNEYRRAHDVSGQSCIAVHAGFEEALIDTLWASIGEAIRRLMAERGGDPELPLALHITGHSLGGALATLAAARCRAQAGSLPQQVELVSVVTFGQPKVGNRSFADWYDQQLQLKDRHRRYVHGVDLVAQLPIPELVHVGTRQSLGTIDLLPPDSGGSLLDRFTIGWLRQVGGTALDDHGIEHYLRCLDRAGPGAQSADATREPTTPIGTGAPAP